MSNKTWPTAAEVAALIEQCEPCPACGAGAGEPCADPKVDDVGCCWSGARVISDREVWRTARGVIEQHCDLAELHAAQRVDVLLAESDLEGQRVWKRILAAIQAIRRPTPSQGKRVN